jgi:serine/threonine protein kinase
MRVQGTPDFITPEQVKCVAVDSRTDIYSFGASLYWCLTGQKVPTYFNADRAKKDVVKKQTFPTPRDLRPEVSQEVSDLIMQCVRYNPDFRPADMVTVLTTLEALLRPRESGPQANELSDPARDKHKPRVVKDWGLEGA